MITFDLKKELKSLYKPSAKQPEIVTVPPLSFLMIDGTGDPNTAQAYKDALEALYSAAYSLKFAFKKRRGIDYPVMALEGLWWMDDMSPAQRESGKTQAILIAASMRRILSTSLCYNPRHIVAQIRRESLAYRLADTRNQYHSHPVD